MINKSLLAASVVGGIVGFATVPDNFGKPAAASSPIVVSPHSNPTLSQPPSIDPKNVCVDEDELVDGGVACGPVKK